MSGIIAWLAMKTKLPQWGVVLIIAGVASLGIYYGMYRYGTAQWNKGVQAGRQAATEEIEKAKKAEWDLAQKKIESAATEVEQERVAVNAQRTELNKSRLAISQALAAALASARATQEAANAVTINIPTDQLDATLRALSGTLAADKPAPK